MTLVEVIALKNTGLEAMPKQHETFRQHVVNAVAELENGSDM
jgi:hypothetical protein